MRPTMLDPDRERSADASSGSSRLVAVGAKFAPHDVAAFAALEYAMLRFVLELIDDSDQLSPSVTTVAWYGQQLTLHMERTNRDCAMFHEVARAGYRTSALP